MSFLGWLTGTDKYAAAQCALVAKYAFSKMTEVDKKSVESSPRWVLEAGVYPKREIEDAMPRLREDVRYCLYSMAMATIGIRPVLKGILYQDQWYIIKNPFCALINAEKHIKTAQFEIKRVGSPRLALSH